MDPRSSRQLKLWASMVLPHVVARFRLLPEYHQPQTFIRTHSLNQRPYIPGNPRRLTRSSVYPASFSSLSHHERRSTRVPIRRSNESQERKETVGVELTLAHPCSPILHLATSGGFCERFSYPSVIPGGCYHVSVASGRSPVPSPPPSLSS